MCCCCSCRKLMSTTSEQKTCPSMNSTEAKCGSKPKERQNKTCSRCAHLGKVANLEKLRQVLHLEAGKQKVMRQLEEEKRFEAKVWGPQNSTSDDASLP